MAVYLEEEISRLRPGDILTVLPADAPSVDCSEMNPRETGHALLCLAREHGITGWFVGRTDDEVKLRLRDDSIRSYPLAQVLFVFRKNDESREAAK